MRAIVPILLLGVGCAAPRIPNPNDPRQVSEIPIETLRGNIQSAADNLFERVAKGEISDARGREILTAYAADLLATVRQESVDPKEAWLYGDVFRTARRYDEARRFYAVAVEHAKETQNQDRRVNDSLRYAELLARAGEVDRAIRLVRETFTAPPEEKAPILVGTYLEVVPAAEGKGKDPALAILLAEAIGQAGQTVVDGESEAGKAFLYARPTHVRRALNLAARLAGSDPAATRAVMSAARGLATRM